MEQNSVTLSLTDAVKINVAAAAMGCTVESLLREAGKEERLLYVALKPYSATLRTHRSHPDPRSGAYTNGAGCVVAMSSHYAELLVIHGNAEIGGYQASFTEGDILDWHKWILDVPQTVNVDRVFVPRSQLPADAPAGKVEDVPSVSVGRPPTVRQKAKIVRQIIVAFEQVTEQKFDPAALPGRAADLLDACQRIENTLTTKNSKMMTSPKTFKGWLRSAGYSFPIGRTPKKQKNFWTQHTPETIPQINEIIFTEVSSNIPL